MFDGIKYIDEEEIKDKKVLLRVDFNISLKDGITVADDYRIRQSLPTIEKLVQDGNRVILVSHLDRPKGRDKNLSLKIVADHLKTLLPNYKLNLVDDFLSSAGKEQLNNQSSDEILMLENIRYYKEEEENSLIFAKELSRIADVYVNDAFGVSHRENASVTGVPQFIPSYGGLLMKREVKIISSVLKDPQKPFIAIIGGAKISDKIKFIAKLLELTDYLLVGGGLANTMLKAKGVEVGTSLIEEESVNEAKSFFQLAKERKTKIELPADVIVVKEHPDKSEKSDIKKVKDLKEDDYIVDIGPETEARFGALIGTARTIIWNGPVGFIKFRNFQRGTDFIYYSVSHNQNAKSVVGGGDTLSAISRKEYLDQITHISTGGGAMLQFIEQGTLPGIEALKST